MKVVNTLQAPPHGYAASKDPLLNRLARVEGQVRGVARMIEEDRYCIDALTHVSAIEAAHDKVRIGLLDGRARVCMSGDDPSTDVTAGQGDELMGAVGRMLRR